MHSKGYYSTTIKFYADKGLFANTTASNLQVAIHEIAWLYKSFGLQLNAQKCKQWLAPLHLQPALFLTMHTYVALLVLAVGIHKGHCGNKVDGLFGLNKLNKSTSRTAGWGLKTKQRDNKQDKRQSKTNETRHARLLGT